MQYHYDGGSLEASYFQLVCDICESVDGWSVLTAAIGQGTVSAPTTTIQVLPVPAGVRSESEAVKIRSLIIALIQATLLMQKHSVDFPLRKLRMWSSSHKVLAVPCRLSRAICCGAISSGCRTASNA